MTVPGYIIAAFTTLFGKQEYIVAEKKGATRKWYLTVIIYLIKFLRFKTNNIVYHLVIPNLFECTLPNIVND